MPATTLHRTRDDAPSTAHLRLRRRADRGRRADGLSRSSGPPFENGAAPEELIGTWLLVEQDGFAPLTLWTVTFTTTGDYIVQSETRALDYQHYYLTGENLIAVTEEIGAEPTLYEFDVSEDRLRLSIPGTDVRAVLERRDDLLEQRPDIVPPVDVDPHPDDVRERDEPVQPLPQVPTDGNPAPQP